MSVMGSISESTCAGFANAYEHEAAGDISIIVAVGEGASSIRSDSSL